ncbi:MAG: hypothetical protein WDW36_005151 [Sanguina aurantia]
MFEGWAADVLAGYLGRFVDVQKDRLRIGLWSGQGVLEDVALRPAAFDYLKLPIAIQEGRVGKLKIQIPWGRWMTGSPLVLELSDVTLVATSREESEWEEGPALQREQAAKLHELAAAELHKLSSRLDTSKGTAQQQQHQQQHTSNAADPPHVPPARRDPHSQPHSRSRRHDPPSSTSLTTPAGSEPDTRMDGPAVHARRRRVSDSTGGRYSLPGGHCATGTGSSQPWEGPLPAGTGGSDPASDSRRRSHGSHQLADVSSAHRARRSSSSSSGGAHRSSEVSGVCHEGVVQGVGTGKGGGGCGSSSGGAAGWRFETSRRASHRFSLSHDANRPGVLLEEDAQASALLEEGREAGGSEAASNDGEGSDGSDGNVSAEDLEEEFETSWHAGGGRGSAAAQPAAIKTPAAPTAPTTTSGYGMGLFSSVVQFLLSFLLQRLQLSVTNVHISFKATLPTTFMQGPAHPQHAPMLAGFHCGSVSTVLDLKGLPQALFTLVDGACKAPAGMTPVVGVLQPSGGGE